MIRLEKRTLTLLLINLQNCKFLESSGTPAFHTLKQSKMHSTARQLSIVISWKFGKLDVPVLLKNLETVIINIDAD